MAYSRAEYPYEGGSQDFPVNFALGYFSRDDVRVYVEGELDGLGQPVYRDHTWISDGYIRVTNPIPKNAVVVLERTVDKSSVSIDPANGGDVTRVVLANAFRRQLMIIHELLDGRVDEFEDIDMIRNLVQETQDLVTRVEANSAEVTDTAELARQAANDAEAVLTTIDSRIADGVTDATAAVTGDLNDAVDLARTFRDGARDARDAAETHRGKAFEWREDAKAYAEEASNFIPDLYLRNDRSGTVNGNVTFAGRVLSRDEVDVRGDRDLHYWMRSSSGASRAVMYYDSSKGKLKLHNYTSGGSLDTQIILGDNEARILNLHGVPDTGDSVMTRERVNGYVDREFLKARVDSWFMREQIAKSNVGTVGTYAFLTRRNHQDESPGYRTSGSNLDYTNANGSQYGQHPSGTWQLMGRIGPDVAAYRLSASLWLRIA